MRGMILSDCEQELDEVFGETNTERNDEMLRCDCFSLNHFVYTNLKLIYNIVSVTAMKMMSSLLVIQFALHGTSRRID